MNSEFNFDEIMERLKISTNTSSYNALAERIGLSSSGFANLKKRKSIPYDKIAMLTNSLNVSMDWILTGKGEMRKGEPTVKVYDRRIGDVDNTIGKTERRVEKAVTLLNELTPQQQLDVLATIEEKKRLNEMQRTLDRLASAWEQEHQQQQSA